MSEQSPTTPAQAAPLGNDGQGNAPAPVVTPAATPGAAPGQVTIPADEYAKLQRDHARVLSFEKRRDFNKRSAINRTNEGEGGEPNEEVVKAREELAATQTELHRERVTNRVRDLLAKPDYSALPESTRKLILKNPAMLSEADNFEEAMLDIEDFIREEVAGAAKPNAAAAKPAGQPNGIETPAGVGGGPAMGIASGLEDLKDLQGTARSRAAIRNALKQKKGVKG